MVDQTELSPELNLEEMAGRLRVASTDKREQHCVLMGELYGEGVEAELRALLAKPEFAEPAPEQLVEPELDPDAPKWFVALKAREAAEKRAKTKAQSEPKPAPQPTRTAAVEPQSAQARHHYQCALD